MKTKKLLLLIALSVITVSMLNAQQITYGIKIGTGISSSVDNVSPDIVNADDIEFDNLYHPGVLYNGNVRIAYKSRSFWGVTVEPGFIQKGWKTNEPIPFSDSYSFRLNCLQLPFLADFYVTDRIALSVGPEFSYLLNAKTKLSDGSLNEVSGVFENVEVAGVIGANYSLSERFDIGVRCSRGIIPILNVELMLMDSGGNAMENRYKLYTQYAQFYLSFKL